MIAKFWKFSISYIFPWKVMKIPQFNFPWNRKFPEIYWPLATKIHLNFTVLNCVFLQGKMQKKTVFTKVH